MSKKGKNCIRDPTVNIADAEVSGSSPGPREINVRRTFISFMNLGVIYGWLCVYGFSTAGL